MASAVSAFSPTNLPVPSVQMTARSFNARKIIAFVAMVFGMFMSILDIQVVSASLSEIQAGLSASADEIPWVQTSYLIAEVIMIPLSGFLSRAFSTREIAFDSGPWRCADVAAASAASTSAFACPSRSTATG